MGSTSKRFSPRDLPDLSGKISIVTGSTSGVSLCWINPTLATAFSNIEVLICSLEKLQLWSWHAKAARCKWKQDGWWHLVAYLFKLLCTHSIIAARDAAKAEAVISSIKKETGNSKVEFIHLDNSSLASVKKFADDFKARYDSLHILLNNAGIGGTPFSLSKDGKQRQDCAISRLILEGLTSFLTKASKYKWPWTTLLTITWPCCSYLSLSSPFLVALYPSVQLDIGWREDMAWNTRNGTMKRSMTQQHSTFDPRYSCIILRFHFPNPIRNNFLPYYRRLILCLHENSQGGWKKKA